MRTLTIAGRDIETEGDIRSERDLLRRQVDALVDALNAEAFCFTGGDDDCVDPMKQCATCLREWSAEQARKGVAK